MEESLVCNRSDPQERPNGRLFPLSLSIYISLKSILTGYLRTNRSEIRLLALVSVQFNFTSEKLLIQKKDGDLSRG